MDSLFAALPATRIRGTPVDTTWDILPFCGYELRPPPQAYADIGLKFVSNVLSVATLITLRKSCARRRLKRLSFQAFCSLPIELILEIFEILHPLDLLHLSQTNRYFLHVLGSQTSDIVWRATFLSQEEQIPACPGFLPAKIWANLLFGPSICWECEIREHNIFPDITLFRRVCSACVARMYTAIPEDKAATIKPLLPVSLRMRGFTCHFFQWHEGKLLRTDLESIVLTITDLESKVAAGDVAAQNELEHFKAKREVYVSNVYEASKNVRLWMETILDAELARMNELMEKKLDWISAQLSKAGYQPSRCRYLLQNYIQTLGMKSMNLKAFQRHLPNMDAILQEFKSHERTGPCREMILAHNSRLRLEASSDVRHWPDRHTIFAWPEYKALIDNCGINGPDDATKDAMDDVLSLENTLSRVAEWKQNTIQELCSMVPNLVEPSELELATSIFQSSQVVQLVTSTPVKVTVYSNHRRLYGPFFGGDDVLSQIQHLSPDHQSTVLGGFKTGLSFSIRGHEAALSLISLMELDPQHTRLDEIDRVDNSHRFQCMNCDKHGRRGRMTLTWKDAVKHFIHTDDVKHRMPRWLLLSQEATASIIPRDRHLKPPTWRCNSCPGIPDPLASYSSLAGVVTHAKIKHWDYSPSNTQHYASVIEDGTGQTSWICLRCGPRAEGRPGAANVATSHLIDQYGHNVPNPRRTIDYSMDSPLRKPVFFNEEARFRCSKCVGPPGRRLRTSEELGQHFRDKHVIPVNETKEWVEIETISRGSS